MSDARLPVSVIGGFLGAGKTTLVNRLLRGAGGRRFAVLVNDFGEIDIDSRLIVSHDGRTMTLANGCVCCSIGDALVSALLDIAARRGDFDHMVIETSGIADPGRVADLVRIEPDFTLDGVIVLADATSVRERAADRYVGDTVQLQLAGADLIVLNKLDLIDDARPILEAIRRFAADRPILPSRHADIPLDLLFGLAPLGVTAASTHDIALRRWRYTSRRPLSRDALIRIVEALPDSVIRAKGIVDLVDSPDTSTILQRVGWRWSLEEGPPWGLVFRQTDIVILGTPEMPAEDALARLFKESPSPGDSSLRSE